MFVAWVDPWGGDRMWLGPDGLVDDKGDRVEFDSAHEAFDVLRTYVDIDGFAGAGMTALSRPPTGVRYSE
jgi:hypothetical protein